MIRLITANWGWKLFSLSVAVALWYLVLGQPELVTSQPAPIFYRNLPRDLEIGSDAPDRVRLELRGPETRVTPSSLAQAAVFIDLSNISSPGENTFTLGPDSVTVPNGVTVVRAVPSQIRIRLDRLISKQVSVQVRTTGSPDMHLVKQEVHPSELRIIGPETRVRQIDAAQTDPIDLTSINGQREFSVHAYVSDPQVRFDSSPVVSVKVWVERSIAQPDAQKQ